MSFYPPEFRQRAAFAQDRHIEAPAPLESAATERVRCPNCHQPAIAPVVSTYLGDGLVENEWMCSACGFAWNSGFNGLQV
jgi:hypothetical protein